MQRGLRSLPPGGGAARKCGTARQRLKPLGGVELPGEGKRQEPHGCCEQWVKRTDRSGSVRAAAPRNLDPRGVQRDSTSPSRGERGFFLSTARRAAPRGVVAVLGARTCGASHENAALELLSSVARPESAAWHIIHCTNRCNMWLLGASAAEEVAEKAALISIDVPADYKWVLLALVGP